MRLVDIRKFSRPNDALDVKKDEVRALLKSIDERMTEFYYATEAGKGVNWGHVGTLAHLAQRLSEINDTLSQWQPPNE